MGFIFIVGRFVLMCISPAARANVFFIKSLSVLLFINLIIIINIYFFFLVG